MGNSSKIVGLALGLFIGLGSLAAWAEECAQGVVILRSDAGMARFRVELADDKQERAQGLMNRETLSKSAGMLFVYPKPQFVGFWMKNTLIPLDMIFLDQHGVVQKVHHNAVPHDETPILGGRDIFAVLEINGGLSGKIGIAEGWQMRHPAFQQDIAAWPC